MRTRRDPFITGLARAAAGAVIFALPMFMTMELWHMGAYLPPGSLAILVVANLPLLFGLSHYAGFEQTSSWFEELLDAFVAYAVGIVIATAILALLGVIGPGMTLREIAGRIAIQALPASIGANLAQSQFGQRDARDEAEKRQAGYFGELFIMAAGALYLAFNVAPTEEVLRIAIQMPPYLGPALLLVSMGVLYGFVYAVSFRGQEVPPEGISRKELIAHYVIGGYAAVWTTAAFVLWAFGRLDGLGLLAATMTITVLAFPCSVGAAAARLII